MKASNKNMMGVTLLEVILALAVAASIITLGLKVYQGFANDAAAQRVRYNVEEIMRAAASYYYANCENSYGSTNTATLDPANNPSTPYTGVTVSSLVSNGFLMKAPALNPLVDSTAANGGYFIQFVRADSTRNYCDSNGNCSPIGVIVNWRIQVSVRLKDATTAKQYLGMTAADCLTSGNGTLMATCSSAAAFQASCLSLRSTAGKTPAQQLADNTTANNNGCPAAGGTYNNYLSWEKLPSMASSKGQSPLWVTNPVTKQFKQSNEMVDLSYMLANPTATYFRCGS